MMDLRYISISWIKTPKVTICCNGPSRRSDLCPAAYEPNFIFRWPKSRGLRTGENFKDSAIHSSANMWDDGTIDPRKTREMLIKCLKVFEFSEHHRRHLILNDMSNFQPLYRMWKMLLIITAWVCLNKLFYLQYCFLYIQYNFFHLESRCLIFSSEQG